MKLSDLRHKEKILSRATYTLHGDFKEPKVDSISPYPVGTLKPPGSNYTKALVMPRLKAEDTSWVEEELGDMISDGTLTPYVYTVDDRIHAKLHPPKNKGHEVMVYLSYIIDFYDALSDVNIFMHSHQIAWHNNDLLNRDASLMIRYLSSERVTREGYMSLRCHWNPGCPDWLHPTSNVKRKERPEEALLVDSWAELFPLESIPSILAQPCCAQFAVSRDRILKIPRMRYIFMRDWLLRTDLTDYMSGRVFEYVWQYIFNLDPIHCPSMSACYCDGYGMCFGGPREFDNYFKLQADLNAAKTALEGPQSSDSGLRLQEKVRNLTRELGALWNAAFARGQDPKQRAIESGRQWYDGDGF